ncbi:hypothetical protein JCM19297_3636 [Nonlabens ulvanivorans]|nr:hypothetical protein JCM19297_3636 [Nonlabens ulvanivorans]
MKRVLLLLFLVYGMASAQEYFPNNDDISARGEVVVAITNATIVTQPGTVINNGTIILRMVKYQI